jgi:limonene-1,2-epoxide hydrolase
MARKRRLTAEARHLLIEAFIDELADYCNVSYLALDEGRVLLERLFTEVEQQKNPERVYYEIFERVYDKIMHTREYGKISKIRRDLKRFDKYELFYSLLTCKERSKHLNCFFCFSPPCPFG